MNQIEANRTEIAVETSGASAAGYLPLMVDPLTGTFSNAFLQAWLEREILRARRYRRKTAVVLVAVDRMARWNQLAGVAGGDRILKRVAEVLGAQVRISDILARVSGDTFALVLPETNIFSAHDVAEKLRRRVVESDWTRDIASGEPVTVSVGVTAVDPSKPLDEAIARATRHLDRARTNGRNRVYAG